MIITKIPKTAINTVCHSCEKSNEFKIFGKHDSGKSYLYYQCLKCGAMLRTRTK